MKKLILISLIAISCHSTKLQPEVQPEVKTVMVKDTVYLPSEPIVQKVNTDSFTHIIESLQNSNDTLAKRLLHARLTITQAKYYVSICVKKPSQDKFLKGWMRRVLEMK